MNGAEELRSAVIDDVAWLRLARPARRNALSHSMANQMRHQLTEVSADPQVRAVVITGDGRAFCAGVDLSGADTGHDQPLAETLELLLEDVRRAPVPTLALIHGPCIGVGCALATACDVRVAHTAATFAIPGVRLGVSYPTAPLQRLVDLVGPGRANVMLLSGRTLSANDAALWGLVDVCAADPEQEVQSFLEAIVKADPDLLRATRDATRRTR